MSVDIFFFFFFSSQKLPFGNFSGSLFLTPSLISDLPSACGTDQWDTMKRGGLATPATSEQLHCPLLFIQSQLWWLTYGDSPSSKEGLLPLTQLPCANHFSLPNPLATFTTLSLNFLPNFDTIFCLSLCQMAVFDRYFSCYNWVKSWLTRQTQSYHAGFRFKPWSKYKQEFFFFCLMFSLHKEIIL